MDHTSPEMARALDNADINPKLLAHWLRHARANRELDIFGSGFKGGLFGLADDQHMHCCKALTLLASWRTETNCHTFVTLVLAHRISGSKPMSEPIHVGFAQFDLELQFLLASLSAASSRSSCDPSLHPSSASAR